MGSRPEKVVSVDDGDTVSANTDILSSDIVPTSVGNLASIFRCLFAFNTSVVLTVRMVAGGTYLSLNSGSPLVANQLFLLDLPVRNGDSINFRVNNDATIRRLTIDEVKTSSP